MFCPVRFCVVVQTFRLKTTGIICYMTSCCNSNQDANRSSLVSINISMLE